MLRSMNSAVTGLQTQQKAMDVIGNNIANVNTAGFKSSRASFEDLFYQTLNGGTDTTNPEQVGYGSQLSSVDKVMDRVGATTTDRELDLYIDGDGYFTLNSNPDGTGTTVYSRVGNFDINKQGYLVDGNGYYVMSANKTATGTTQGKAINLESLTGAITFDDGVDTPTAVTAANYGDLQDMKFNSDGSITASLGGKMGTLKIDQGDGTPQTLNIAIANFVNQDGLSQLGSNYFAATNSSGPASYEKAKDNNDVNIRTGALEMSNVDLAREFTNMIITERGYQSNSKVITTSDEMLQELLNLKR